MHYSTEKTSTYVVQESQDISPCPLVVVYRRTVGNSPREAGVPAWGQYRYAKPGMDRSTRRQWSGLQPEWPVPDYVARRQKAFARHSDQSGRQGPCPGYRRATRLQAWPQANEGNQRAGDRRVTAQGVQRLSRYPCLDRYP